MEENSKNMSKYNAYKQAFTLMELAKSEKNLPYSIASIAIAESIIADRTQSYISYKEKRWFEANKDKHIRTATLVDKCNKHFKNHSVCIKRKNSSNFETDDLFLEIKDWLKNRNNILHAFAKSNPGMPTMDINDYIQYAIKTSEEGYRLISLLKQWFDKQKRITKTK
ncbi:hypothetical protein OAB47_05225 [Vicingaceae bacterium]|nr:hypothetical protein [Vicingaceae bacterium]